MPIFCIFYIFLRSYLIYVYIRRCILSYCLCNWDYEICRGRTWDKSRATIFKFSSRQYLELFCRQCPEHPDPVTWCRQASAMLMTLITPVRIILVRTPCTYSCSFSFALTTCVVRHVGATEDLVLISSLLLLVVSSRV